MNTAIIGATPTVNPFAFEGREVRTVMVDDNVWFCAKDVFTAMEITWTSGGVNLKNIPEKWLVTLPYKGTYGVKDTIFISEAAIYKVSFRSNKPEAERFTNWVCEEVLPAIRKTGFYGRVDPKTRLAISKQVSALVADVVVCRNLMQQEYLIGEIRDLCNMIGKPMPDMTKLHRDVEQRALTLGEA